MYGRPQGDQGVFANTFSDDSLGDSTRSLLSPVFHGDGGRFEPSELSEGSPSSGDETDKESLHQSRNSGKDYSLDFERSYTSDKPRANGYTTPIASNSFSRHKSSSRKSTSSASRSNTTNHKSGKTGSSKTAESKGDCLSPWESWLIKKTAEDREKAKQKRLDTKKETEESERKKWEREQLLKQASEKYEEWLERKKMVIAEERRTQKLKEQLEQDQKENSRRFIFEKAAVKYNNWLDDKKVQEREKKRKEEINAREKKEREVERKLHSEEAYINWMAQVKERPKPVYNSFGYTGGMLTGYYEWGSYPAPSYYNPIPWVPPKVKTNCERRKGKKELQPASPPLLFRDIDLRKAKEKKK